jgi:DNA polymerase-3 subunit epsilon
LETFFLKQPPVKKKGAGSSRLTFVAIDFETADYEPDSACALGLVKVKGNAIAERAYYLIRPPRREFIFTDLHGITWEDVAGKPNFKKLWSQIRSFVDDADFLAAHNASFDAEVLYACCKRARLKCPRHRFVCTVELSDRAWGIYPRKLPHVCRHLGIRLKHHDALSDAEACARIVIAAIREGITP